nr:hypothetical protein CFP56_34796 [Quercus suber]
MTSARVNSTYRRKMTSKLTLTLGSVPLRESSEAKCRIGSAPSSRSRRFNRSLTDLRRRTNASIGTSFSANLHRRPSR